MHGWVVSKYSLNKLKKKKKRPGMSNNNICGKDVSKVKPFGTAKQDLLDGCLILKNIVRCFESKYESTELCQSMEKISQYTAIKHYKVYTALT